MATGFNKPLSSRDEGINDAIADFAARNRDEEYVESSFRVFLQNKFQGEDGTPINSCS